MTSYRTREGDTADWIAWSYYGSTATRVVERLLEANPGLADRGPVLPSGLLVTLPDMPAPARTDGVRLWD